MARVDDYQQARDLSAAELAVEPVESIAQRSGLQCLGMDGLRVSFLDRVYRISYPDFEFTDETGSADEIPLQEQVLILHYLRHCQPRLNDDWIAYRDIPGAGFYFSAFAKRAVEPFRKVFGSNMEGYKRAAARLKALPLEAGTPGFEFKVFPFAPIRIILWEGDDEFPAEANILFDDSIAEYLSPEDAAWLASLTVYRLMALSR